MLELEGVSKSYGGKVVVQPVSLQLHVGQTYVLIGPSGCGKSTMLQLLVGLTLPTTGTVRFEGRRCSAETLPELRLRMGYVIQDGGLFPHLTAAGNVRLMPQYLGWEGQQIRQRMQVLCDLTRFPPAALERFPSQLSGGQQQRVSLMRALMLDPELLLLDEPLGALDPMIRSELQRDLREIFLALGKTVVLVTHDLGEAAFFADSIVLMRDGYVVQCGSYEDLLTKPSDPFVTQFINASALPVGRSRRMIRIVAVTAVLLLLAFLPWSQPAAGPRLGSKKFTESVILGEILTQLFRDAGSEPEHYRELGGTRLVFDALRAGDIDAYVEYTGTIQQEILAGQPILDDEQMARLLEFQGIRMSRPLGFNNSYALGMRQERADELGMTCISDLARRPDLLYGFGSEFMNREDGWPNLRGQYGLAPRDVQGMDHDLAYRQLDAGAIDVMDVYTTDAKVSVYDIALLEDDRQYFPRYDAVILYRADLAERHPELVETMLKLEGQVDGPAMTRMNARAELARADLSRVSESRVAAEFLADQLGIRVDVDEEALGSRLWKHTVEHLDLVRKSLVPAILVAIPLGVVAARQRVLGQIILSGVGIIQTIPALALLVILMKPVSLMGLSSIGAGSLNAVAALFLYSLLPIVRNTYSGLQGIPPGICDSAEALGLPRFARLRLVELPMASPTILAGIKTAAVMNVGFATLGALVGAGGYGQPILTGIRLNDNALILEGATAAACLALVVQGMFELAERFIVPRGLRLRPA